MGAPERERREGGEEGRGSDDDDEDEDNEREKREREEEDECDEEGKWRNGEERRAS